MLIVVSILLTGGTGLQTQSGGSGYGVQTGSGGSGYGVKVVEDYSDIIFYHDCDAKDDANRALGSASVTYDAGILVETSNPIHGTGSWDNNNDGWDNLSFNIASNMDFTNGCRIGFYHKAIELNYGTLAWTNNNDFEIDWSHIDADHYDFLVMGSTRNVTMLQQGVTQFIEVKFENVAGNQKITVYFDGVSKGSTTGTGLINDTTFNFFSDDANAWDSHVDQVIISNDINRDLYKLRNVTNFDY